MRAEDGKIMEWTTEAKSNQFILIEKLDDEYIFKKAKTDIK
jgi:hypothetical protein